QPIHFLPTPTHTNLTHQSLMSIPQATNKIGLNIQYCMSLPCHILSALQIPRVTQARTSTDYAFHLHGKAQQWTIGISSMFTDAIEVLPEREILIATLSTGPVSPGDAINYTNTQHIMKCCRGDGELYSTRTNIHGQVFYTIFASAIKQDYLVYPSMIGAQPGVIWSYDNPTVVSTFDDDHPLNVSATKCHDLSICLWYVSPLIKFNSSTKYALLGEWNKWTAISSQRVIATDNEIGINLALITVYGLVSEVVSFLVYHSTLSIVNVACHLHPDEGEARIVVDDSRVGCY
ncbi:unnamed protein product, partial [Rotaria sordida]